MARRWWKIWLATGLAVLAMSIVAPLVSAHATLLRSDPADGAILGDSPRELHLWFDEDISSRFSSAQLFDINSQPLEIAGVRSDPADQRLLILTLPELSPGVYSVLWKVLSEADGHFNQGLLVFGVGEEADLAAVSGAETKSAPPLAEVALRWLNFTLLGGVVGALAVVRLVLVPGGNPRAVGPVFRTAQRRVLGWAGWCAGLALLVGLGLLVWQTVTLLDSLPEGVSFGGASWQVLSRTRWGGLWLIRQAILLALGGVVVWLYLAAPPPLARRPSAPWLLLAGLLSVALLTVQALGGHAAGITPNTTLAVVADGLHLLAASLWVGGLLALVVGLLPLVRRRAGQAEFAMLVRAGWRPFSRLAAFSVGLLLATGLYNTGRQVASIDAFLTTLYGQALLTKIGLMLAVSLFGLLNAILLHPRLAAPVARLLGRPPGWSPLSLRRLPTLVVAEVCLGMLVFLTTGLVTASPAPRGPEFTVAPGAVPSALSGTADDVVITLQVKPNRPGRNVFTVFAASTRRPAPAEIIRVNLRFTYLDQDLGRVSATAEKIDRDRYLLGGNYLSLAGPWQIDVVVRRRGLEDSVAQFDWIVAPPGETRPVVISKRPIEAPLTIAAAGTILAILAGWFGRRKLGNLVRGLVRAIAMGHVSGGSGGEYNEALSAVQAKNQDTQSTFATGSILTSSPEVVAELRFRQGDNGQG
jgi:copper transport protein